jgi:uncharacterized C2H2 Zn-finger protein
MAQVTDPDRGDMIRSIIYILIYVIVIGVSAFYLLLQYWYVWFALVLVGMLLLVNWHKQKTAYRCPKCEHIYEVSFLADLVAPHGIDRDGAWLYLRCPNCHERSKTKTLKKVE